MTRTRKSTHRRTTVKKSDLIKFWIRDVKTSVAAHVEGRKEGTDIEISDLLYHEQVGALSFLKFCDLITSKQHREAFNILLDIRVKGSGYFTVTALTEAFCRALDVDPATLHHTEIVRRNER